MRLAWQLVRSAPRCGPRPKRVLSLPAPSRLPIIERFRGLGHETVRCLVEAVFLELEAPFSFRFRDRIHLFCFGSVSWFLGFHYGPSRSLRPTSAPGRAGEGRGHQISRDPYNRSSNSPDQWFGRSLREPSRGVYRRARVEKYDHS